jgi:hypothetical protein
MSEIEKHRCTACGDKFPVNFFRMKYRYRKQEDGTSVRSEARQRSSECRVCESKRTLNYIAKRKMMRV